MLAQRRANMPRLRQPLRELQGARHLRLARTIPPRHFSHHFPRLQLRMPHRLPQAQDGLDTGIKLGEQRTQVGKVMLFELALQRFLELVLLCRLHR
ncbi:hypothetical protein D3C72_2255360 [compost metagenome]